jgi:hypothetical protein
MKLRNGTERDGGKGLNQHQVEDPMRVHWVIEGYDVYPWSCWEGTHSSRGAHIDLNGVEVHAANSMSAARAWIREQTGKERPA